MKADVSSVNNELIIKNGSGATLMKVSKEGNIEYYTSFYDVNGVLQGTWQIKVGSDFSVM